MGQGGNDTLSGGAGNDTYRFSRSDGRDTIVNADESLTSIDTMELADILHEDIWLTQNSNDLVIDVIGTNDQVRVKDWFIDESSKLDTIDASDLSLQQDQVAQLVNAMAVFDVPTGVGAVIPQDVKDQLTPVLSSSWG